MSQTKAQLIQPIGIVTAGGVVVTGVVTASSFDGDVVGTATSIISGGNLNLGDVNATTFSGDFTGNATGINTGAAIKVGSFTATNFTGDFTGTATSMMRGTGFKAGVVNATGFNVSGTSAGTIAGNVTGDVTGDVTGVSTGNVTGNVTGNITGYAKSVTSGNNIHVGVLTAITFSGDGSNLTGIAATNFNTQVVPDNKTFSINVTNDGSSAYTLSGTDRNGSVSGNNASVSVEIGDTLNFVVDASGHPFYIRVSDGGANVSTPAATNQGSQSGTVSWTPNTAGTYYYQCGNHAGMLGTITVTSTTTIDLSSGNCITFNQSASTTVAFANTEAAMDVTIIRYKDASTTVRTITWPDSISWNGGSAPTLGQVDSTKDFQQFQLITRDSGLTWYAWQNAGYAPESAFFAVGQGGGTGGNAQNNNANISSPAQIPGTTWVRGAISGQHGMGIKSNGTMWVWGDNSSGGVGVNNRTQYSSPVQIGTRTAWNVGEFSLAGSGDGNFFVVDTSNQLWCWGEDLSGHLGQNSQTNFSSPVQIPGSWSKPFSGTNGISGAIKNSNELWMWGNNESGQVGQNNRTQYSSPKQIPGSWSEAAAGYGYAGGIKTDGTLWVWGRNDWGQLGINSINTPDNTGVSSPIQIPGTDWKEITGRSGNGFAVIKTNGELWNWGTGSQGNLGQNNNTERSSPVQIPGTTWDTFSTKCVGNKKGGCLKTDGSLWTWSYSSWGELGQNGRWPGPNSSFSSPTQVGSFQCTSFALGNYNMVYVRDVDTL